MIESQTADSGSTGVWTALPPNLLQAFFQYANDAILVLDPEQERILEVNSRASAMLGYNRPELLALPVSALHPGTVSQFRTFMQQVIAQGHGRTDGLLYRRRDGTVAQTVVSAFVGTLGVQTCILVMIQDASPQKDAQAARPEPERGLQGRAQTAEGRYRFLLQASTMLSAALNPKEVMEVLVAAAVPTLAELCIADMMEPGGAVHRVGAAGDGAKDLAQQLASFPPRPGSDHPAMRTIETGESELVPEPTDELLRRIAPGGRAFRALKGAGLRTYLCVPIVSRRQMGALTLLSGDRTGRPYAPADLALAEDLARRAGLALDNARAIEASKHMALTLQRSLLPASPLKVPGLQVAARYRSAGEGSEVGGDFYDVLATGRQEWAAFIGDVCGKGPEAAALTALARHTLRAAKMQIQRPRRVLRFLNQAILEHGIPDHRFVTVAYCRIRAVDGGMRLTVSRGGHPPPLLLRACGQVQACGSPGTLLGVLPEPRLSDRNAEMAPGDALVMYTDGVTDAEGSRGRFGEAGLQSLVEQCAGLGADEIADRIEQSVLGLQTGPLKDDMALLVIRIPGNRAPGDQPA